MRQGRLLMDALRRGVRFLTVAVRKHLGGGAFRRAAQSVMDPGPPSRETLALTEVRDGL